MVQPVIALQWINGSVRQLPRAKFYFIIFFVVDRTTPSRSIVVHLCEGAGAMKRNQIVLPIVLAILVVAASGRVYYLPTFDENRYSGLTYPIPNEQSSRDLDLSFSAGDADEADNRIRPVKRVYTVVEKPEKPIIEMNKEELPITRYKLVEAPVKGLDNVIVVPESSRKSVKIDGNNKGEVILELRVIANHDTV